MRGTSKSSASENAGLLLAAGGSVSHPEVGREAQQDEVAAPGVGGDHRGAGGDRVERRRLGRDRVTVHRDVPGDHPALGVRAQVGVGPEVQAVQEVARTFDEAQLFRPRDRRLPRLRRRGGGQGRAGRVERGLDGVAREPSGGRRRDLVPVPRFGDPASECRQWWTAVDPTDSPRDGGPVETAARPHRWGVVYPAREWIAPTGIRRPACPPDGARAPERRSTGRRRLTERSTPACRVAGKFVA